MKISIILPGYNVEKYISKCLDSIISQTYSQWEAIVIDDGSSDNTLEICKKYQKLDSRIQVYSQAHCGVSSARNHALKYMSGDYAIFIDADDWLTSDMLEKMINAVDKYQSELIVCNYNEVMIRENKIESTKKDIWKITEIINLEEDKIYTEVLNKTATLWNKMFSAEVIAQSTFHTDIAYGEDSLFLLENLSKVKRATILPDALYNYCINREGNVVSHKIDERALDLLEVARLIAQEMLTKGYVDVAFHRIYVAVVTIIKKIPPSQELRYYEIYFEKCKKLLHIPKFTQWSRMLFKGKLALKEKLSLLTMCFSIKLFYRIKKK